MCLCRTKVSHPPHPASPPPPLPKNNHTVNRRQCCETLQAFCNVPSILQRANYLATSQHLQNVPPVTSYNRENSEHSVKTGSKSDWKKFTAEHQERVTSCMCLCRTKVSRPPPHPPSPPPPPPPLPTPPTPKIITRSFVHNVVKRFNHLSTCQASCNVPTFLQPHNIF